mmetsp:Transcript_52901/g.123331  ORF Transcript_52901/g.123331 Transcript_52901/m.123331 type:complete len:102 (+) Transcript_52901:1312-1617(+)
MHIIYKLRDDVNVVEVLKTFNNSCEMWVLQGPENFSFCSNLIGRASKFGLPGLAAEPLLGAQATAASVEAAEARVRKISEVAVAVFQSSCTGAHRAEVSKI